MRVAERLRLLCLSLLLGSALAASLPARGQGGVPGYPDDIGAYDPREMAMLPRYCIHTNVIRQRVPGGDVPDQVNRWRAIFGKTYEAMHHYCWGLMKTNRALLLTRARQHRAFYLDSSIAEFDYVIKNAPADFALLPEILTKKGENLIRLGRAQVGLQELARAIELKPDYWPPYVAMSDHFKDAGDRKKAREVLEKALSLSPASTTLQSRLAELDGMKDRPKSAAKPAGESPGEQAPDKDRPAKEPSDAKKPPGK